LADSALQAGYTPAQRHLGSRKWDNLGERSFTSFMQRNSVRSPVETLVRSASRRRHGLLAIEELSYALAVVLSGAILLLLLGTQILDWYWLVLLALVGLIAGAVRLRGRLISCYQVAQILDRRLHLSDTLSTAWFVLTTPSPSDSPRHLQVKQAEEVAADVHPQTAFPFEGQRALMLTALLLVIAGGLFGLRYFAYDQLTFQRTLVPIRFGSALEQFEAKFLTGNKHEQQLQARNEHDPPPSEDGPNLRQNQANGNNSAPGQRDREQPGKELSTMREGRQLGSQPNTHAPEESPKQESPPKLAKESASPTQNDPQQRASFNNNGNKNSGEQAAKGPPDEPSLTSKLRDALSGLLAKMQGGPRQQLGGDAAQPPSPNRNRSQAASSASQQSAQENAAGKEADANSLQAQQQAQSSEMANASRNQGSGDSSGHRSSDTRSAAGRQNGSKDAKEAEQLKAMGKLAEIIGKRSASVTGEMTVETRNSTQQLQTGYTHKIGSHSGISSVIDHDDVPMDDQQYVREYMKQVHSQPEAR